MTTDPTALTAGLFIDVDAHGTPCVWRARPDHPDAPEVILSKRHGTDPTVWAIVTTAIEQAAAGDPDDATEDDEPSYWYAEGYSAGRYGTTPLTPTELHALSGPARADYAHGETAGRAALTLPGTSP